MLTHHGRIAFALLALAAPRVTMTAELSAVSDIDAVVGPLCSNSLAMPRRT